MIIPLGDDVEKRNLPLVSILLVAASVLGFLQLLKVGLANRPGQRALHRDRDPHVSARWPVAFAGEPDRLLGLRADP